MSESPPLVVHVVYGFHTGGLENGIVNLINSLDPHAFRHAIVSLATHSPDFAKRIQRDDVRFIDLNKTPGHGIKLYPRLFRLFRRLKPAIVHTRNLAALEAVVPAWMAGVPVRIHGEHGWDVADPDGSNRKYLLARRAYRPFVTQYVALSTHLERYLVERVGIRQQKVSRICNGVDTRRFHPVMDLAVEADIAHSTQAAPAEEGGLTFGTVGRLQPVKDQLNLIKAFGLLLEQCPERAGRLKLVIVGDGPMRDTLATEIASMELSQSISLAGERDDIADAMRAIDVFVLPSLAEGISNTVLEAMACGLPVVATCVGGNPELIVPGETGELVPAADPQALARAMQSYVQTPGLIRRHGLAARQRVENRFSLSGMVSSYQVLYEYALAMASHRLVA